MINYQTHTLGNGLRIVHKPIVSNVSYCGFIVNAGTRDEYPDEHGMAHFVEHMLFKGTKKRRSYHIVNRMESVGGDLNAFTNKEETVIYSAFLEEHFQRAIELLSDLTFNSEFPQIEIEKEVDVVIDEIHSYEDTPSELIFDEFENLVFKDSAIGHNILGDEQSLLTFDTEKVRKFVDRYYVPENIVFFSLGKTDFKKIIYWAEKYMGAIKPSLIKYFDRLSPQKVDSLKKIEEKDTAQAHVVLGGRSYSLHHPQRRVLKLLNNILGGPGMNSRLNLSLREKRGYVYTVDSSVTSYTDTGVLFIYFGCDKKNVDKCLRLVEKEILQLKTQKMTDLQLSKAKKQFMGQLGVMNDNHENIAMSLGKSFMHYNHFSSLDEIFSKVDSITSEQVLEVANEIFDERNLFRLIYN
ncbi:pitrilysin family protein [Dysgonomonas sp. Marseille-P4361]|uniref:M16 family metallopeptidase n=1 Tax=Dysgonomonas sp. Marseille-P4361 TaxID=2161820 RepID=UPI000D5508D6|nr:pitrilysin family protein [Dysgonomonas sp. Marseille-P4361]